MMASTYDWEWRVPGTPEQLWPIVADTERFNRLVENPSVQYEETPDPRGGSLRKGRFRYYGVAVEWHEPAWDWREPDGWSVVRRFERAPFREVRFALRLEPEGSQTRLCYRLAITLRTPLLAPILPLLRREFWVKTKQLADRIIGRHAGHFEQVFKEPLPSLPPTARARLETLGKELIGLDFAAGLVKRLVHFLLEAPDYDLIRIRPFAVADRWKEDRLTVLRLFLHATRLGLLELSWDMLCPDCRGAKERLVSLSQVRSTVHCASCNIDFEANFDSSVELTFRPAPAIRQVEALLFCAGGPGSTPHIVTQRLMDPASNERIEVPEESGAYRLRSPQVSGAVILTVAETAPREQSIAMSAGETPPAELVIAPGGTLHLRNADADQTLVILERTRWADDAARASFVTALQEFRDLFGAEILAPGVEMGVSRLAFLFSDLKSSTAMYAIMGDAPAFSLVQQHFRILEREVAAHRGGIVKTIGDAIMAVFSDAADCVEAGIAIQRAIASFNATSGRPPVTVKLGAHLGPTIAVNLNDRLDYFGTTVNVAARVQNESDGGDLVLTEELLADPGVQLILRGQRLEREVFEVQLKGLERPYSLTRFRIQQRQGTGLLLERVVEANLSEAKLR